MKVIAATIALTCFLGSVVHAATYHYTGTFFHDLQDTTLIPDEYSTSNRITGFIELPSLLGANLTATTAELGDQSNFAVDYSFTDGRQTYTKADFATGSGLATISFSTDSVGNVTGWLVQLLNPLTGFGDFGGRIYVSSNVGIEVGEITSCSAPNNCSAIGADKGISLFQGAWTVDDSNGTSSPTPVPLPSPLLALVGGLAVLVGFGRRQSKR